MLAGYAVITLVVWWVGIIVFEDEISKPHTDTGSGIFLIGLVWPAVLVLLIAGLIIAILGYIVAILANIKIWG
jgi:hypothetical protein